MPCSYHDISVWYVPLVSTHYIDYDRKYISHVPYTSAKIYMTTQTMTKDSKIWCDNFSLLGQVLRKTKNIIYLTPEKFEKYRFLIDVYAQEHKVDIRWEVPEPGTCQYILSSENQRGYIEMESCMWELLDHNIDSWVLVRNFDQITNVTLPILQKVTMHISQRTNNHDISSIVEYLTSHEIDDELVISCSFVILYYKMSPDYASKYVLNWLRKSTSIQSNRLKRDDLWMTNWSYYSHELQQELKNHMCIYDTSE